MQKERNLFRIDTGNTHGWQVRIERYGKSYTKFFSDSLYEQGPEGAWSAARIWRDQRLSTLPDPESPTARLHSKKARLRQWKAINRSGVKGIGFSMTKKKRSDERTPYVQAYWRDEQRKPHATSFSVEKHGGRGALKLAVQALIAGSGTTRTEKTLIRKAWPHIKEMLEAEGYHPYRGYRLPTLPADRANS